MTGGVTTAHQVPAVSQSAYSPPTPETPDALLAATPQIVLTKTLGHLQTGPALLGPPPPTQPTAKVAPTVHTGQSLERSKRKKYGEYVHKI